ncbi:hypothetical protein Taro_000832 [Colocasia esculenta]|uniref:Uncharacterized protein n=1 Tax=Colocasia esculenta TaxID=4460 RepID=A0A843TE64_COLES|nr:hypothetical protein [Colocasia esculenta]
MGKQGPCYHCGITMSQNCVLGAKYQEMVQALHFGGMDHQRSQSYAMLVVQDGGQKEHLQTTLPFMPVSILI